MNVHPPRGRHLLAADRTFVTGSGLWARLLAPGFQRLLDRIDEGLEWGAIEAHLPDGSHRRLGGRRPGPVAHVELVHWRALVRLMVSGSVGWYRGWADGDWTSADPVPLFDLVMRNRTSLGEAGRARGAGRLLNRLSHLMRRNTPDRARRNIAFHYDLGNDFYRAWLDGTMSYSSALFEDPCAAGEPLEAAQQRKITALLDRLELKPGQRLLDIGCGWGALLEAAVADYGVDATGITLSTEQRDFTAARLSAAGLADRARPELRDYRHIEQSYDAVTSIEMVEAVGEEYWPAFMAAIARALKPGGRAALQYIAIDDAIFEGYRANADFIQAYIFPGGMLISESRFRAAAEAAGLEWRDRFGFGIHYAETLRRWRKNFDAAVEKRQLPAGFDPDFVGLWRYYLMYCEGGFRGGGIDVAQVTLVKK
jgi:cyclopropane-fatty-acyl-phospholipid synthase